MYDAVVCSSVQLEIEEKTLRVTVLAGHKQMDLTAKAHVALLVNLQDERSCLELELTPRSIPSLPQH